jgi:energy-coupling factor transporter ATP-binding protein EcfA2
VGDRGVLILGGNGTGKSSIVDAVEIAIAGESSLYPDDQQGVNWDRASPHVIGGAPQVTCSIEDDAGTRYEISLGAEIPESARAWIESARSSRFVLRRHMLLRFIVARPAERYQTLSAFLNLSAYTAIEEHLHTIADTIEASIAEHDTAVNRSEQKLRAAFGLEQGDAIDLAELTNVAKAAAVELGLVGADDDIEIQDLATRTQAALSDEKVSKELEKLAGLKARAAGLSFPSSFNPQIEAANAACVALEKIEYEEIQMHLVAVINASLKLLSDFEIDTCPVCESEIDREQLEESLRSRLTASEELIQAKNAVGTMTESLRRAVLRLLAEYRTFIDESAKLAERDEWQPYVAARDALVGAARQLQAEPTIAVLATINAAVDGLVTSHDPILAALDLLIAELGGTERWNAMRNLNAQSDLCLSQGERLREAAVVRSSLTRQLDVARAIATHASEARKQAVAEILENVTATANQYYEIIHPGEGISTSQLQVRAATDASVRLVCEFAGAEENPLLHFSESHLDTLGLCYFLAIRRKQADSQPGFKLMVLDDVMHSVDADHRRRVIELLRDYFSDHQLIVTTHDPIFYRNLRQIFRRGEVEQHRIGGWSLERGPVLADSSTDIDRITVPEIRNDKSAEELAAAAGRFLENLLKKLTERLQINVQARFETRYTIGDLWPRLEAKLNGQRSFKDQHGDLATQIGESVWLRSEIGAHDNEDAAPPTEEEVREFAVMLTELYEATFCADCRDYLTRQDNRDWMCRCGALNYPRG